MTTAVQVANPQVHELAEGPVWDPVRERLLWVDIRRGLVFSGELRDDGTVDVVDEVAFGGTVGAVAVSAEGDWVVAGGEQLLLRDPAGVVRPGPRILPPGSGRRLNDGKPDPAGRFLVGSLHLEDDDPTEELLAVLDADGTVRVLDDDLTLSNGLAWTADGTRMYSIDTLRRTVYVRDYGARTGAVGPRTTFLTVDDGHPDGMCLDAEEHLWIAMYGLGQVRRYSPAGELVATIEVPAQNVSCVAFAGPRLDTLVITTATQDLTPDQLAELPDSGRLFTATPGVRGLPLPLWSGPSRFRSSAAPDAASAPRG
ncbi:SMP-30/gluconolactonase/LRE family protein [Puerhibacterium sp. TATVAM-FAB25]|uniref:SMP-30/gluconolactonase/LRE family protein n=1 Tax=Puerhibacterium sp. TATVAM-FAB25 TaxID=3093699 RepID=UPI00397D5B63